MTMVGTLYRYKGAVASSDFHVTQNFFFNVFVPDVACLVCCCLLFTTRLAVPQRFLRPRGKTAK